MAGNGGWLLGPLGLLAVLALLVPTAGLGARGVAVGVACGAGVAGAVALGLRRHRHALRPADLVTSLRALLACAAAALVADPGGGVTALVVVAAVALATDAVDGRLARRTGPSPFGARYDGETDAFLILVLSVHVAGIAGAWVLAIGVARYAYAAAGWVLPRLRADLPPRYWRKVVAAVQGIVLAVAAAEVLPAAVASAALLVALALLAESFGRDVVWSWRHGTAAAAVAAHPAPGGGLARPVATGSP